jgi:hypothetical protein
MRTAELLGEKIDLEAGLKFGSDSHLMILHGGLVLFLRGISTMASNLRLSSLIPAGLIVESTTEEEGVIVVSARRGNLAGLPAV